MRSLKQEFWEDFLRPFVLPLICYGILAAGVLVLICEVLWANIGEVEGGVLGITLGVIAVIAAERLRREAK